MATKKTKAGRTDVAIEHDGVAAVDRQMSLLRGAVALLKGKVDYSRDQDAQDVVNFIGSALDQSQQMRDRFELVYGEV